MGDFWGLFDEQPEVNRSEDIIRKAIAELETGTGGRIKGTFSKIEYTKTGLKNIMKELQRSFRLMSPVRNPFEAEEEGKLVEIPDEELENKGDVNSLYGLKAYKFEIYTSHYKFRIFQLFNSVAFPVAILLDEGIANDLKMSNPGKEITSNEEMEHFLRRVLSTNKVRNVVNQLLVLVETESAEKIQDYLRGRSNGATVAEIAEAIDWSQSLTLDRLQELQSENKVEGVSEHKQAKIWKLVEDGA